MKNKNQFRFVLLAILVAVTSTACNESIPEKESKTEQLTFWVNYRIPLTNHFKKWEFPPEGTMDLDRISSRNAPVFAGLMNDIVQRASVGSLKVYQDLLGYMSADEPAIDDFAGYLTALDGNQETEKDLEGLKSGLKRAVEVVFECSNDGTKTTFKPQFLRLLYVDDGELPDQRFGKIPVGDLDVKEGRTGDNNSLEEILVGFDYEHYLIQFWVNDSIGLGMKTYEDARYFTNMFEAHETDTIRSMLGMPSPEL